MFPIRIRMACATSTLCPRQADDFRSSILSCPCFTLSRLNPEIPTWVEPTPGGDSRGGWAGPAADVSTILGASGRDLIMIETVGVGQDEVDIVRLANITVVILVPGMGDDVQSIKAGIMEIADIFVINKSDREGAERVEREIRALQSLAVRGDNWTPPIVKTVATDGTGIPELAAAIGRYEAYLQKENLVLKRNIQNWQERLVEMLRDALLDKARAQLGDGERAPYAAEGAEHKRDPYTLVEEIVQGRRH